MLIWFAVASVVFYTLVNPEIGYFKDVPWLSLRDGTSALFAVWTAIGNIGYGFGPLVARTGTFIDYPDGAILIMTLAMILGRLGLLAVLVLLLPTFWRR